MYSLFPRLSFIPCLAIAACLTPTDPIISAAIVGMSSFRYFDLCIDHTEGGTYATKHVPLALRRILLAESAANDGLAFPFLTMSLYLLVYPWRAGVMHWILIGCLCTCLEILCWEKGTHEFLLDQVILGTAIGVILGSCRLISCATAT
jgi:sodium/hydrogen antiporter